MQQINVCAVCDADVNKEDVARACAYHVQSLISMQKNLTPPTPPPNIKGITLYSNVPTIKSRKISVNLTMLPTEKEPS